MKTIIVLSCLLFIHLMGVTQNELPKTVGNLEEVEVSPPLFTGVQNVSSEEYSQNMSLLEKYMYENMIFDAADCNRLLEGTEIVQFEVNELGIVSNIRIINSVCYQIDEEVTRVLKKTNGMWQPGRNNAIPVGMKQEVSLAFANHLNIENSSCREYFTKKATSYFTVGSKHLLVKGNSKKAVKYFNKGIRYLPNEQSLLLMRGLALYDTGDVAGAERDWQRFASVGGNENSDMVSKLSEMNGHSELLNILAQNENRTK